MTKLYSTSKYASSRKNNDTLTTKLINKDNKWLVHDFLALLLCRIHCLGNFRNQLLFSSRWICDVHQRSVQIYRSKQSCHHCTSWLCLKLLDVFSLAVLIGTSTQIADPSWGRRRDSCSCSGNWRLAPWSGERDNPPDQRPRVKRKQSWWRRKCTSNYQISQQNGCTSHQKKCEHTAAVSGHVQPKKWHAHHMGCPATWRLQRPKTNEVREIKRARTSML